MPSGQISCMLRKGMLTIFCRRKQYCSHRTIICQLKIIWELKKILKIIFDPSLLHENQGPFPLSVCGSICICSSIKIHMDSVPIFVGGRASLLKSMVTKYLATTLPQRKRSMETDLKLSFLYSQIDVGLLDNIGSIRFFVQLTHNTSIISCTCHLHSSASLYKGTFLGTFDHWGCVHSSQWRYIPWSSVEFIIPGSWIIIYK